MSELNETQRLRGRPVTLEEAVVSAHRFIAEHFKTDNRVKTCIPVEVTDDDIVLMDYIFEAAKATADAERYRAALVVLSRCSRCAGTGTPQHVTCDAYQFCVCKPGEGIYADKCWACEGTGIGSPIARQALNPNPEAVSGGDDDQPLPR